MRGTREGRDHGPPEGGTTETHAAARLKAGTTRRVLRTTARLKAGTTRR